MARLLEQEPHNLKALNLTALALIGKGDTSGADEYFEKALAVDPRFAPALKNLSISEFNSQKYAAAEKHLQVAESVTPEDQTIPLYLGEIFYRRKAYEQAAGEFAKIDQLTAHNPIAGAHLAISYLRSKDVSRGKEASDLIAIDKLDAPTQFDLALALDGAGWPTSALPLIDAVYAEFPEAYDIAVDRMMIQLSARKFSQAISAGKEILVRGQDTAEVENLLAESYAGDSQFQSAFDAYRRAINLAPQDEENYIDLASLCLSRRSFDIGLKVIDVGLTSHPQSQRLIFMRGLIHATEGDFEASEHDFTLSDSASPQNDLGTIGLGAAYLQNGQYDQAIKILRAKLRERPDDPSLLYLFAETLLRSGANPGEPAFKEAQEALAKSVNIDPSLCLPHVALGKLYLDENRIAESVEQFEDAKNIDPTERAAYSHLAVAYRRLGKIEKANEALGVLRRMSEQDRIGEAERMKAAVQQQTNEPESNRPSR